jgi:phage tail-like protein
MPEQEFTGVDHYRLEAGPLGSMGAFTRLDGLGMEVELFEYAEGGHNDTCHFLPGRVRYRNLVLSRGLTKQASFLKWFWQARNHPDSVTELTVVLRSASGLDWGTWAVDGAYPVRWSGPVLDARGVQVAEETVEIAHTGLRPQETT